MTLKTITEGLPETLRSQLLEKEKVHYFSYISFKGGCLRSSSGDEYWIALTNKRVFYKAKIKEDNKTVEKDGILPSEKISFIEVSDVKTEGCSSTQAYVLSIGTSGSTVGIPLPTKEKGYEIRETYIHITESNKK